MKKLILFIVLCTLYTPCTLYSQWIPQNIPVTEPLLGIEFVDENTGWAISYNTTTSDTAYVIGTTNGGANWNIQFAGDVGLYCIDAIDNNICYAGGADTNGFSIFLKTTNGGLNWQSMNVSAFLIMTDMFFINKDTGYACDEFFGGLRLTTDGGLSWVNRDNGLFITSPRTLFFLNYDTGFCGGNTMMFKTTNAGLNWFELFDFGFLGNRQPLSLQFLNNDHGWAALSNNGVGITTNGGLNWSLSNPDPISGGSIPSICIINDSLSWSGSQSIGKIYRSDNKGYNWITQNDPSGSRTISILDTLKGWSGYFGISKTTNGGLTFINGIISEIHTSFKMYQNYPNPFNPSTNIRFTIIENSDVSISVFDILGRDVFKWKSDGILQGGTYEYTFTGENLSAGVYIYKLTAKSFMGNKIYSDVKKMIFLK